MKIFFDENFSYFLVRGMEQFQKGRADEGVEVYHVAKYFERGIDDTEWIPKVAKLNGIIITQDLKINRTQYLYKLFNHYDMGFFFIKPPSKKGYTYWEWIEQIIRRWSTIKRTAKSARKPFGYVFKPRTNIPVRL